MRFMFQHLYIMHDSPPKDKDDKTFSKKYLQLILNFFIDLNKNSIKNHCQDIF